MPTTFTDEQTDEMKALFNKLEDQINDIKEVDTLMKDIILSLMDNDGPGKLTQEQLLFVNHLGKSR